MGDIIWGTDFRAKRNDEASLEQQAIEIITVALMGDPVPLGQEPVIYIDTSPCEYSAPLDDPA